MSLIILHVADIKVDPFSGMGRIVYFWKKAFEEAGHTFYHIGREEVPCNHPSEFLGGAMRYYKLHYRHKKPDVILAHEPVSGKFIETKIPVVLFSHGIEQREWNLRNTKYQKFHDPVRLKSKLLFPIWRLKNCNRGLKKSILLLLSNSEDQQYAIQRYNRKKEDIVIFRNGVKKDFLNVENRLNSNLKACTIGFSATWIRRKGTDLIVEAAKRLQAQNIEVKWLLFGTVFTEEEVKKDFPKEIHPNIDVIPKFNTTEEKSLFQQLDLFILPSFFEGQSLALLQAMGAGLCSIASDCCAQIDLIQHKENGLLFKTGNASDLLEQIKFAVNNPDLRKKLGENAAKSVEDRDWSAVSEEVVKHIEKIA
ncbi:glycosyltransferase family 4 protein [Zunongwangia sp.]|uniref:glycosyltransferase family 4 protein n=1 Tax=Zunongwangia sp. TaxID=1965325 RepID=UPI003AA8234C